MARRVYYSSAIVILLIFFSYNGYFIIFKSRPVSVPEDIWWGECNRRNKAPDAEIREFKIAVSQQEVNDIHHRLHLTRYPSSDAANAGFRTNTYEYGLNSRFIKQLITFIQDKYNFTQRVNYLNSYPQYVTNIQGLNIHFIHIRPENTSLSAKKVTLLMLHGWPSAPSEFYSLIPLLTGQKKIVFEIIIPSIPGFGYSEAPNDMHVKTIAVIMKNLMVNRLKISKFYIHGTDWGALIGASLSTLYPQNVLGYHSNFCVPLTYKSLAKVFFGSFVPWMTVEKKHRARLYPLTDLLRFYSSESGYMHLMGSKPDTIGMVLENSVEGLLAFNLEKFLVGANKNSIYLENAGLDIYNVERLLDITFFYYWFPRKSASVARIYRDNLYLDGLTDPIHSAAIDSKVPCGCVYFRNEFVYFTEFILKDKFFNLTHYKTYDIGGHYPALEKNTVKLVCYDLNEFITKTLT